MNRRETRPPTGAPDAPHGLAQRFASSSRMVYGISSFYRSQKKALGHDATAGGEAVRESPVRNHFTRGETDSWKAEAVSPNHRPPFSQATSGTQMHRRAFPLWDQIANVQPRPGLTSYSAHCRMAGLEQGQTDVGVTASPSPFNVPEMRKHPLRSNEGAIQPTATRLSCFVPPSTGAASHTGTRWVGGGGVSTTPVSQVRKWYRAHSRAQALTVQPYGHPLRASAVALLRTFRHFLFHPLFLPKHLFFSLPPPPSLGFNFSCPYLHLKSARQATSSRSRIA
jgi:hypothetical protein